MHHPTNLSTSTIVPGITFNNPITGSENLFNKLMMRMSQETITNNEALNVPNSGYSTLPLTYTVLEVLVAFVAFFGNLLVILVFLLDRRLRKVTNFYIISLSLADLLVGAIGIPTAILTRLGIPHHSTNLCISMLCFLIILCTTSILNLVAVSLDRYWAILHPLDYHKRISGKNSASNSSNLSNFKSSFLFCTPQVKQHW